METYSVVFTPEAEEHLVALYQYIREETSAEVARRYASALIEHCEKLDLFPHRGVARDDIRPGLRITHHQRRTVIAYAIDGNQVSILGFFHGGRDYESALKPESDD